MSTLWRLAGALIFWLAWPAQWLYLRHGRRTRLFLVVDDNVLLLKGWIDVDQWDLPGGGIRHNERSQMAMLRELKEETGIVLQPKDLTLFYKDRVHQHGLQYDYDCYLAKLAKRPVVTDPTRLEIRTIAWTPLAELSELPLAAAVVQAQAAWLKR